MLKLKLVDYSSPFLSAYLVDGHDIRDNTYLDFTEGGNWLRYDFIPEREIWMGGVHIIECPFIFIHELSEVIYAIENNLDITLDDDYSAAHSYANTVEQAVRDAPNTVDSVLTDLLDRFNNLREEEKMIWQM